MVRIVQTTKVTSTRGQDTGAETVAWQCVMVCVALCCVDRVVSSLPEGVGRVLEAVQVKSPDQEVVGYSKLFIKVKDDSPVLAAFTQTVAKALEQGHSQNSSYDICLAKGPSHRERPLSIFFLLDLVVVLDSQMKFVSFSSYISLSFPFGRASHMVKDH